MAGFASYQYFLCIVLSLSLLYCVCRRRTVEEEVGHESTNANASNPASQDSNTNGDIESTGVTVEWARPRRLTNEEMESATGMTVAEAKAADPFVRTVIPSSPSIPTIHKLPEGSRISHERFSKRGSYAGVRRQCGFHWLQYHFSINTN